MALPANIQQFKSSGVYRLEFDKSQLINIPAETIRLVIGYSNKGPFNTPIFCPDAVFFTNVFGGVDNSLELKGSYFHRSCLTALDRGPILALNLMILTDSVTAQFRPMSAQSDKHNSAVGTSPVSKFFNQDKFWFIDDDAIIAAIDLASTATLFNYANTGKKTFSVITVKSDAAGYDETCESWYGSGKVPVFLDEKSYISDFLVRVIVLDGDFSNFTLLSTDPIYGAYFNKKGLMKTIYDAFGNTQDGIDALIALPSVTTLAEYTGSFIPEFVDKDGTNLYIEDIINNETSKTGLSCAIQEKWYYDNPVVGTSLIDGNQVDMIGHGLEKNENGLSTLDFLSYYGALSAYAPYSARLYNNDYTLTGVAATGSTAPSRHLFIGATNAQHNYTLAQSTAYSTGGAVGAFDKALIYGPNHPTMGASSWWPQTVQGQSDFETFATSVVVNTADYGKGSWATVGVSGTTGTTGAAFYGTNATTPLETPYTLAPITAATTTMSASTKDLLTIQIKSTDDNGWVGGLDSGTVVGVGAYFTLGYPAGLTSTNSGQTVSSAGEATLEIIPSLNFTTNPAANDFYMYGGPKSQLGLDSASGLITDGDRIQGATETSPMGYARVLDVSNYDLSTGASGVGAGVNISIGSAGATATAAVLSAKIATTKVSSYTDAAYTTQQGILSDAGGVGVGVGFTAQTIMIPQGGTGGATYNEAVFMTTLESDINQVFPVSTTGLIAANKVFLGGATGASSTNGAQYIGKIQVGQYLVRGFDSTGDGVYDSAEDTRSGTSRLTRIKAAYFDSTVGSTYQYYFVVETESPMYTWPNANGQPTAIERYKPITEFVDNYRPTALSGYTIPTGSKPNDTNTRMNEILDVMYTTNIADTLEDRDAITFRYIVDTFNHGIEPSSKSRLSKICKNRQNAFAILNSPSIKEFKESTNPMFKYDSTTQFDPQYIASGGNMALNPTNIYSMPGIADGANYCGFYTPNLRIFENGATKYVPPAAHISNLYIDKYMLALPWSIVAGPRRGVVSGTGVSGVEYEFDRKGLDYIEPFGLNAVINKRGFGLVINANQTAQQTVKSALSQIHVRELLIYLEDGIAEILRNYRWEFNTAQNRLEIKTLADNFCSQILNDGGFYDFQNVMDTTNNTTEVIDNNIGILDTYVEPVRGMGILVNRVTILKTGAISSGNF